MTFSTYLNTLDFHITFVGKEQFHVSEKLIYVDFLETWGARLHRGNQRRPETRRAKRSRIGIKGWDRNGRRGIQIEKVQKVEQIPRISRLVWNQLSLWRRNQCIGGCIRVAKSNLAHTWCTRYIDIYLLGRFTPQSTVLGCLVFTSRATTLLVFPLENTRTYPRASFLSPFLSTVASPPRLSLTFIALSNSGRPGISRNLGVVLARITCRSYV